MLLYDWIINLLYYYVSLLSDRYTGKPPPGSRNQYLPGLPVYWFACWLVGRFADLLLCGFECIATKSPFANPISQSVSCILLRKNA